LAILTLFYPAIMIHAGLGDLRTMRIPNRLILLLLAGYVVAVPLIGLTLTDVLWAVAAAAAVFAFGFLSFSCRWMGGGDVKLMTVAALWLGAGNVVPFIFYTSIFGALLTILVLIFRQVRLPAGWQAREWIARLHRRDAGVPYGVAIAAAGVVVYLRTPWVVAQL
jgi:prepilin peptidase CpaA